MNADISRRNVQCKQKCHESMLVFNLCCDTCGETFSWYGDLKTHVRACLGLKDCANRGEPEVQNEIIRCKKTNARKPVKLVVKKEAKPRRVPSRTYQCEICGKLMKKGSFRHHKLIHSRENSYSCNVCGRSFNNRHYLTIHSRRTHSESRNYKCDVCQKGFKCNSAMRLHVRRAHNAQKTWACHFCQRLFTTKSTLRNHVLTHTKEKPHQCSMCERRFTKPDALKVHLRIHTKEKPFSCEDCGKTFSHKVTLVKYHRCPNANLPQQVESDNTCITT